MAKFRDLIDPLTMKSLVGGAPKIQAPSGIEYDTEAFKRADPMASVAGGIRGLEESRALSQSTGELILKGVGNIVENVVFETLKAPGNIYGAVGSALGSTTAMDNLWLESFNAIQESTASKLTEVYVPPSVQEKGLWGQIFNPYFFASEGADAVGTLLSFMLPGMWMKTLGVGSGVAKGIAKAGKLGDLAVDGSKFVQLAGDSNKLGKFLVKTLGSTGRGLDFGKLAKNIDSGLAVTVNTVLESSAEAMDTYETLLQQGKTPEEASIAANKVMGLNMALLTVSNTLLEKYVFNGFNRLPSVGKQLSTALKGGTPAFKPVQQGLAKFAAGTIAEGFIEEGLQTTFQQEEGDFAKSLQRYADNFESLFGEDPDIEFGKAVFLGGLLGGTVGGISGVADVREQKALLMGRGATTVSDTPMGKIKAMLGYTAKEKQEGLIEVMTRNFDNLKLGKDQLKNLSVEGKLDATKLQDETYKFAIGNYFDDLIEKYEGDVNRAMTDLNVMLTQDIQLSPEESRQVINTLIPETLTRDLGTISKASALELVRLNRDIAYFSRFASNPAGFEMLDAHIEDVADTLEDRYELSTGVKLRPDAKKKLVEDMKGRAKRFENVYQAARTYNVNTRYDIEVAPEEKLDFEKFMQQANARAVDSMLYSANLEEMSEKLALETEQATRQIEAAKNKYTNRATGPAGEQLTKDQKDDLLKEREAEVATAKSSVVDYDAKVRDLAMLKATVAVLKKNLLDNATATRLKQRWEADRAARQLVKQGSKITFDGIEIPVGDRVAAYNIISNVLTAKGYTVLRDPATGLPIVGEPFYVTNKKGNIYEIVQQADGFTITNQTSGLRFKNKPATWLDLFKLKQFSNLTVLTKADYAIQKQKIDDERRRDEEEIMIEAMLSAFGTRSDELKNNLTVANAELNKQRALLKSSQESLANILAKFTKKGKLKARVKEDIDVLKEQKRQLEISINSVQSTVSNLEQTVEMLTSQINALQNTQLYFLQNREKLRSLAKPKEGFTTLYDRAFFEAAMLQDESTVPATELQAIIDMFDQGLIDNVVVQINEQIGNIREAVNEFQELTTNLQATKDLIDLLLNEAEVSTLVGSAIPKDILDKWVGLEAALATKDNTDIFKYLYNIASGSYKDVLQDFVKDVAPYLPIDSTTPVIFSQYAESQLESYKQVKYTSLDKLKQRVAIIEQQREELQRLYSKMYRKLRKLTGGQVRPPWDPLSDEEGYPTVSLDEKADKSLALATTAGKNIETTVTGDLLGQADEGYYLPVPNSNVYQRTFFRWLDTLDNSAFSVIPYMPKFNDTDFEDITDADTAAKLRDAIADTPLDAREEAIYTIVLDENNQVMSHEGYPLINSLMTVNTKFGTDVKVANRALLTNFLEHVTGQVYTLTSSEIKSDNLIDKDKLEIIQDKLKDKGYEISLDGLTTKAQVYQTLLPFAIVYNKLKYQAFLQDIKDKYVSDSQLPGVEGRNKLAVTRVSKGIAIKAFDSNNKPIEFPAIESLQLKLNAVGNPNNFHVVKADFKGIGKDRDGNDLYRLEPGRVYIQLENKALVPIQTQRLTDAEIEVALYLISKLGGYVREVSKLEDLFEPGLQGSIRIGSKDVPLSEVPVINMKTGSISLMSMFMNWGTDLKKNPKKYDIFVTKGMLNFGGKVMSTQDIKDAYEAGNYQALAPLIDFLRTKRLNINYNLLKNTSGSHYGLIVEEKQGVKKLVAVNKNYSYVKSILDRANVLSPNREVLDKYGLPRFAQKYLEFNDAGVSVDVDLFKQEILQKKQYVPKIESTPVTEKSQAEEPITETPQTEEGRVVTDLSKMVLDSNSYDEFYNRVTSYFQIGKNAPYINSVGKPFIAKIKEKGAVTDWKKFKDELTKPVEVKPTESKSNISSQLASSFKETQETPVTDKKDEIEKRREKDKDKPARQSVKYKLQNKIAGIDNPTPGNEVSTLSEAIKIAGAELSSPIKINEGEITHVVFDQEESNFRFTYKGIKFAAFYVTNARGTRWEISKLNDKTDTYQSVSLDELKNINEKYGSQRDLLISLGAKDLVEDIENFEKVEYSKEDKSSSSGIIPLENTVSAEQVRLGKKYGQTYTLENFLKDYDAELAALEEQEVKPTVITKPEVTVTPVESKPITGNQNPFRRNKAAITFEEGSDLRRNPESILEAAISRGIINKTNCK